MNAVSAGVHTSSSVMLLFFIIYSRELSEASVLCIHRRSWLISSQGAAPFPFLPWLIPSGTYHEYADTEAA